MKKFSFGLALILSLILTLSSCKSVETGVSDEASAKLSKEAVITTAFSETTTTPVPETTTEAIPETTTAPQTTSATTLPETVSITTVPTPATEVTTTPIMVSQMIAPAVTVPISTAIPLATTVAQTTTAEAIQQKLVPISSTYTYNNLSSDQKIVYNKILSAIKSRSSIISFDNSPSIETVTNIYSIIYTEEINLQYLSESFKYDTNPVSKMQISYIYSTDTINTIDAQTEAAANAIVAQITPTMTTFDIIKFFHDTIIKKCTYDDQAEFSSTAYGALVKGRALCQGYSHAMSLLCNKVGIENAFVTGFATEAHMWNLIKINGNWYNIDVTWDDPDRADLPDFIMYDYFNVTNAELSERQLYSSYTPLPIATATIDNYYTHYGLVANSVAEAEQILYNEYIKAANAGGRYVNIKFANEAVYDQAYQELITNQGIFAIQVQANAQSTNKFNASTTNLIKNRDMLVIHIIMKY